MYMRSDAQRRAVMAAVRSRSGNLAAVHKRQNPFTDRRNVALARQMGSQIVGGARRFAASPLGQVSINLAQIYLLRKAVGKATSGLRFAAGKVAQMHNQYRMRGATPAGMMYIDKHGEII